MTVAGLQKWSHYLEVFFIMLAFTLVLILGSISLLQGWGGVDFSHYWTAARTFMMGADPYIAFLNISEAPPPIGTQFVHPPWVALFFVPISLFSYTQALIFWILALTTILAGCLFLIADLSGKVIPKWQAWCLAIMFLPFSIRVFHNGQLTLVPVLAGLLAWHLYEENRHTLAGTFFSLALIKLWPMTGILSAFLIITCIRKQWKFLWSALISGFIIVALTTAVWPNWWTNYTQVDFSAALGKSLPGGDIEIWPLATLVDFVQYVLDMTVPLHVNTFIFLSTAGIVLFGITLAWKAWRHGRITHRLLIAIWSLIPLITMPYMRSYDHVVIVFWLLGYFTDTSLRTGPMLGNSIGIVAYMAAMAIRLLFPFEPWHYWIPVILFIGTSVYILNQPNAGKQTRLWDLAK